MVARNRVEIGLCTHPPGYIGWRNRFLGIESSLLKLFTIRALAGRSDIHVGCTGPPGYKGWRNRFLGIESSLLKRLQILVLLFEPCLVWPHQLFSPTQCLESLIIERIGSNHRVHILVEMKQGQCICPLSWSVHCNFTGDGKCNERGGRAPPALISQG
jgi:hypothetical protein